MVFMYLLVLFFCTVPRPNNEFNLRHDFSSEIFKFNRNEKYYKITINTHYYILINVNLFIYLLTYLNIYLMRSLIYVSQMTYDDQNSNIIVSIVFKNAKIRINNKFSYFYFSMLF